MKEFRFKWLVLSFAVCFVFGLNNPVSAGNNFNGNGFPSGPHFNLNIKAKDSATFTCPAKPEAMDYYCPTNKLVYGNSTDCLAACGAVACIEVYSNVINFPQGDGTTNFTILMESGREKPKGKPTEPSNYPDLLEVTDWCMGFGDNDNAAFRIPADPDGYAVYARLTGDPKENPSFDFTDPRLAYVEDGGQDLLHLGFVTPNGVFNTYGGAIGPISRTKGQGVSKAIPITPLFMWAGDVCTFGNYGGELTYKCCIDDTDTTPDVPPNLPDGVYDSCVDAIAPTLENPDWTCAAGVLEETYCVTYGETNPVWVFNIAEFVGMLFDIDPDGPYKASLIQIRFYPLPLQNNQ